MAIPEPTPQPQLTPEQIAAKAEAEKQQRSIMTWSIIGVVAITLGESRA